MGNSNKNLIHKPIRNQMTQQQEEKGDGYKLTNKGRDLDEELTTQNFINGAR